MVCGIMSAQGKNTLFYLDDEQKSVHPYIIISDCGIWLFLRGGKLIL